jgi:hypothetical protein
MGAQISPTIQTDIPLFNRAPIKLPNTELILEAFEGGCLG